MHTAMGGFSIAPYRLSWAISEEVVVLTLPITRTGLVTVPAPCRFVLEPTAKRSGFVMMPSVRLLVGSNFHTCFITICRMM